MLESLLNVVFSRDEGDLILVLPRTRGAPLVRASVWCSAKV